MADYLKLASVSALLFSIVSLAPAQTSIPLAPSGALVPATQSTTVVGFEQFKAGSSMYGVAVDGSTFVCCSSGFLVPAYPEVVRTDDPSTAGFFGQAQAHSGAAATLFAGESVLKFDTPQSTAGVFVLLPYAENPISYFSDVTITAYSDGARKQIPLPIGVWTQIELNTQTATMRSFNLIAEFEYPANVHPVVLIDDFYFGGGLSTPSNLRANQIGNDGTQIQLTWDYGSDPIDGFTIERKSPLGVFTPLPNLPLPTDRSYKDTLPPDSGLAVFSYGTYSYRVRAYVGGTNSEYSNVATCYQLRFDTEMNGKRILVSFSPDIPMALTGVAQDPDIAYDHFNWVSVINHYPLTQPVFDTHGTQLNTNVNSAWLDPPIDGYGSPYFQSADPFPYYWNELPGFSLRLAVLGDPVTGGNQHVSANALFRDLPFNPLIAQGDYIGFFTTLVGVKSAVGGNPPNYTPLTAFAWSSNNNGSSGTGIGALSNVDPPTQDGSGGIFNAKVVDVNALPLNLRQMMIQNGAQGVSNAPKIDKDAPMTAAFLSGPKGTNGSYTGSVTVTLIATDIDGPTDIAATSYRLDGGSAIPYTAPFTVSGNGTHSMVFGSVDRALNAETPLPSQSFKIDSTAPVVVPQIVGSQSSNGWYRSNVSVSWSVTDPESGIASSTGCATTNLTADTVGMTLTCSAINGAGLSGSVPLTIKIDRTLPVISGMPAPGCSLWPPNHKLVQVATVKAIDALSGLAPGSFKVTGISNEAFDPKDPDVVITPNSAGGFDVQLRSDRDGNGKGRIYTLTATAMDLAGNPATAAATCTVPHDQGK